MTAIALVLGSEEARSGTTVALFLAAAVVLIALNAFYVAYEFAILAAKRSTFESPRLAVTRSGRAALDSMSDLSMQLAGAQLGITMASLALGYVAEPAFESILDPLIGSALSEDLSHAVSIVGALGIVVFLHLVLGEMVPKNIALAAPDSTMRWLVLPYRLYLRIFRPFIVLLNGMANAGCRLVGVEPRDELVAVHSASELAAIISHSRQEGALEHDDAELLSGALEFAQKPIGDVATPLDQVSTLRLGATVAQAERVVAESGQERIPIARPGHQTPFIGYVHARDLLAVDPRRRSSPLPTSMVRSMAIVRQERVLIEVLRTMRRVRRQMVLVVDDAGNAMATASIEDVVKALIAQRLTD